MASDFGPTADNAAQMFLMQVKSPIESKAKYDYDLGLRAVQRSQNGVSGERSQLWSNKSQLSAWDRWAQL